MGMSKNYCRACSCHMYKGGRKSRQATALQVTSSNEEDMSNSSTRAPGTVRYGETASAQGSAIIGGSKDGRTQPSLSRPARPGPIRAGTVQTYPLTWYGTVLRVPTQGEETRYKKVPYLSKASFRRINTGYYPKLRKWLPVGQKSLPLRVLVPVS